MAAATARGILGGLTGCLSAIARCDLLLATALCAVDPSPCGNQSASVYRCIVPPDLQARSGASGGSPAHSAGTAATLQSPGAGGGGEDAGPCLSPSSLAGTDPGHECGDEAFGLDAASSEASLASRADDEGGEAEAEYTVVHNGMAITHVPASEVSKVRPRAVVPCSAVPCGAVPYGHTTGTAAAAPGRLPACCPLTTLQLICWSSAMVH